MTGPGYNMRPEEVWRDHSVSHQCPQNSVYISALRLIHTYKLYQGPDNTSNDDVSNNSMTYKENNSERITTS
jgi:hypothetical protein